MTWGGGYGSHAETSLPSPVATWYLAEGATHSGFDLFYLLQNPNDDAADGARSATCCRPACAAREDLHVPPHSRFNIWVDAEDARRSARTPTCRRVITSRRAPIIVERAMYLTGRRPRLRRRPRERGRHRAGDRLVPGRRRDGAVLRPVRADRQPDASTAAT